jgi:hypothetical protein
MNDDKKVLSTKLSIKDYNIFQILTKLEYGSGLIREESPSELLRFTIHRLLSQLHNNRIYYLLEQEQQQNQVQNNQQQQQLHSQVIPTSTSITTAASSQHQVPNIFHRNNLAGQKMTPWKLSSLLSSQTNQLNYSGNSV